MMTDPAWRTSSYSGGQGNCIEVGSHDDHVLVRDTQDRTGPVLAFSPVSWHELVTRLKDR
jgi:Domain of unknown function (DUF397)